MNRISVILLFIFVTLFSAMSRADTYMLDGVQDSSANYNVKKVFGGVDDDLCWAFSASNAIKYWQDRHSSEIPVGTPIGNPTPDYNYPETPETGYSSDIVQVFVDNWVNDGGEECNGFNWWFAGTLPDDPSQQLKPDAIEGGFWKDTPYGTGITSKEVNFNRLDSDYDLIADTIDEAIESGFALTCGIYSEDGGAHAITLWGYEEVGDDITGLWICDSDNDFEGNYYMVDLTWDDTSNVWNLGDSDAYDYSEYYLGDISVLMAGISMAGLPAVPEPAEWAAIFGVVALLFVIYRRKK